MEETQIIATEDKNNPDYSEILDQLYRTHQLNEEQSFDKINMTEWIWPKNVYLTEKITPTNMNVGTWPKKYDNNEHERLNMTEIK